MLKIPETLKKGALCCIFAVTPITLTGCSFEFQNVYDRYMPNSLAKGIEAQSETFKELGNLLQGLDTYIDDNDLSEDDLEDFINSISDSAEKAGQQTGFDFIRATLVRVVDGDTIVVQINGQEEKVRLIGIDTPESVASNAYLEKTGKENTEAGKTASEYTKHLLENVSEIYLQTDVSDIDRYGRKLRYVWLEQPYDKDNTVEVATKMLNAILIKDGYAEVVKYPPDTYYNETFNNIYKMSHEDGYEDGEYELN